MVSQNNQPQTFAERVISDPRSYFEAPQDVVTDTILTPEEKRKVLESWQVDALELQEAENENMGGGESAQLQDVTNALRRLSELGDKPAIDPDK